MSRPAPYGNVLDLADQALASENGLVVECDIPRHATNLRMNFYAKRTELRDIGDDKYDDLICTVERNKFVVFKKRDAVRRVTAI